MSLPELLVLQSRCWQSGISLHQW